MSNKNTKAKNRAKRLAIPIFTIAELEDAGRLEPGSYLIEPLEKYLMAEQKRAMAEKAMTASAANDNSG